MVTTAADTLMIPSFLDIYNNDKSIAQLQLQQQHQQHRLQKEQIASNLLDSALMVTTAVGTSMIPPYLAMNIYNNDMSITQLQLQQQHQQLQQT